MTTLLAFIVVLGVLIFVHEAGHFLAAKWAGIYVHRFSIGIGNPVPFLRFRRGETEYAISWLPIGGYVKMATQEETAGDRLEGEVTAAEIPPDRWFEAKPVWQRIVVISAGVVMNALFAWLVFTGLALANGRQVDPTVTVGRVDSTAVPAGAEGLLALQAGDRIATVDGAPVDSWDGVVRGIQDAPGNYVALGLGDGRVVRVEVHADALTDRIRAATALLPYRAPVVGQLVPGRPAEQAGLGVGDTILAVDGEATPQWYDVVRRIEGGAGRPLSLALSGPGGRRDVSVTPLAEEVRRGDSTVTIGRIGVGILSPARSEPYTVGGALLAGTGATWSAAGQIVRTLRGLVSGRVSSREVGGPILIGQMAGQTARLGLDAFLAFMALISVNLAVLNLLPIPVLDGGHLVFLVAEAALGRPLPVVWRHRLTLVGLAVVGLLMAVAFTNDLTRLFGG